MIKTSVSLSILAGALVALAGCSPRSGPEYFWSGKDGSKTFRVKITKPSQGTTEGTLVARQQGMKKIAGKDYYELTMTPEGLPGAGPQTIYSRLGKDGMYTRKTDDPSAPEILDLPFPAEVGRTWTYLDGGAQVNMEIAAAVDLKMPTKTYYRCLKVKLRSQSGMRIIQGTTYYAPSLGVVLSSVTGPNGVVEISLRE